MVFLLFFKKARKVIERRRKAIFWHFGKSNFLPRVRWEDQSHICLLNMRLSQQNTVRQEKINTAGGQCVQIGNCAPKKRGAARQIFWFSCHCPHRPLSQNPNSLTNVLIDTNPSRPKARYPKKKCPLLSKYTLFQQLLAQWLNLRGLCL